MEDKGVRARKNLMFYCFYPTRILVGYLRGAGSVLFAQLSLLFLKDNYFFSNVLTDAIEVICTCLSFIFK